MPKASFKTNPFFFPFSGVLQHIPIYKSWALQGREWTFQVAVKYSWARVNDRAPCPITFLISWENGHELRFFSNPSLGCLQLVREKNFIKLFPPFFKNKTWEYDPKDLPVQVFWGCEILQINAAAPWDVQDVKNLASVEQRLSLQSFFPSFVSVCCIYS